MDEDQKIAEIAAALQKNKLLKGVTMPLFALRQRGRKHRPYRVIEKLFFAAIAGGTSETAAALSYSLLSAMLTFMIFLNGLLALLSFDKAEVSSIIQQLFGGETGQLLLSYFEHLDNQKPAGLLLTGSLLAIFSLAQMVNKLLHTMSRAYGITDKRPFFKQLFLSVLFTALMAVTIYFTLIVIVTSKDFLLFLDRAVSIPFAFMQLWGWLRFVLLAVVLFLLLLFLYCLAPNRIIPLKQALPGAFFALAAEMAATIGFSFYVEFFSNHAELYGVFGGVVLLLLWLYWTAFILILGNECNCAVMQVYGRNV